MRRDEAPFLTVAETAARLNVCVATVYRRARRGRLPGATRVGKAWRVDGRRLDAALFGAPDSHENERTHS